MIGRITARRVARGLIVFGLLLGSTGCIGPLAPTPGFGDEVRGNRDSMVENPEAALKNTARIDGISPSTAKGVLQNYHRNEEAENQSERQNSLRQDVVDF